MYPKKTKVTTFIFLLIFLSAACTAGPLGAAPPSPIPNQRDVTQAAPTTNPVASEPAPSLEPTTISTPQEPAANPTQTLAARTDTPAVIEPTIPLLTSARDKFVRDPAPIGIPSQAISAENAMALSEIARWGNGRIRALAFTPDLLQAVVATSQGVFDYSLQSYKLGDYLPLHLDAGVLAFSPSLRFLALGDRSGAIRIWDLENGRLARTIRVSESPFQALAFSPHERLLYSSTRTLDSNEKVYVWDVIDGSLFEERAHGAQAFEFSADGLQVAARVENLVKIWRFDSGESRDFIAPAELSAFSLSPDGSILAIGMRQTMQIQALRVADAAVVFEKQAPPPASLTLPSGSDQLQIADLTFSPDGKLLAAHTGFGETLQWRTVDGSFIGQFTGGMTNGSQLGYSPDGRMLVNWQGTALFRNAQDGSKLFELSNHLGSISSLKFSPSGERLSIGVQDGRIWQRRVRDGAIVRSLKGNGAPVLTLAYSPNGEFLLAGGLAATADLWMSADARYHALPSPCEQATSIDQVSASYDNQYAAYHSPECPLVSILRVQDSALRSLEEALQAIAFSPSEPLLACGENERVTLRHMLDYSVLRELPLENGKLRNLVFSSDGGWLAISGDDLTLWDIMHGAQTIRMPEGADPFRAVAFSPDNQLLAAGTGQEVWLYRLTTLQPIVRLYFDTGDIGDLAFSPDGFYLAIGLDDGVVMMWGIASQE